MAPLAIDVPGAYPATPSNEEPTHQTQPSRHDFAKEIPRSGPYFHDSGTHVNHSSSSSESAKPGVMTAACSRIGTRDSALTQNANYTYDDTSTAQLLRGNNPHQFDDRKPVDTPTKVITPANTPAEATNPDSNVNNTANAKGYAHQDRNKVQASLRGKSSTQNNEPYWGSIPFGVGVYNGVTGHGSNASTTQQKSLNHPDSNTTISSGVYNGVAGHGSKESTSPRISRYDQYVNTDDSSHQQRAFPLVNNADTKADAKPNDADAHKRDSHFKEALAGTGGAAAAGYAAHEYSKKDRTNEVTAADEKGKDEKPSEMVQTKSHTVVSPRSHKGKEAVPATNRSEKNQTLERQQPLDTEEVGTRREDSNLGYYGAAAAAAGAGAYGMHKYASRDGAREQSSAPEDKDKVASFAASRGGIREAAPNEPQAVASNTTATREQPRYDVLSDDTSSGIVGQPFDSNPSSTSQNRRHKMLSGNAASGNGIGNTRDTNRSSSDSSHGGLYNVLASGTPSGINLEHAHISRKHHH